MWVQLEVNVADVKHNYIEYIRSHKFQNVVKFVLTAISYRVVNGNIGSLTTSKP